jgi:hypothetical protein
MADNHKKLDYVISACGMMGVFTPDANENWYPLYKETTVSLMRSLKARIAESCVNTDPLVSVLYNAYTEKNHVREFERLNNLGADSVYADSGGLQIVTAGKSITPEMKNEIYKTQTYSDYAMCFDVIPLSSRTKTRTRNERSNVGNKVFNDELLTQSAHATGDNVKAQATYFRKSGAKTKVIVIVQGNSADDMVNFFNGVISRLEPEDYENIGGMAVADTCIGNGELESIEMLRAAKRISEFCHPNIRRHLHVLGVGSISRMRPILYLLKSGYLNNFERVSYDSSSHTSTFQYGLLKVNGTCRSIGSHKTPDVDKHFRNVYNLFSDTFSPLVTEDRWIELIFADGSGDWKYSTIKNRLMQNQNPNEIVAGLLCNAAHTYFQIHNFVTNLDRVSSHKYKEIEEIAKNKKQGKTHIAMNNLLNINSEEQIEDWCSQFSATINSKRISRDSDTINMEDFFV